MKRVLVADKLSPAGLEILKARADIRVDVKTGLKPEELKQVIPRYEAIIVRSSTRLTADVLKRASKLKVIARAGVGVDNVDVETATKLGILVLNTPEGNTISTCELTMGMLLCLARSIPQLDRSVKEGEWLKGKATGAELFGKTLGLVGLGRIGGEVARRAEAFGMNVIAYDPYISPENASSLGVELVSLRKLLRSSDFISIHAPLNSETYHLISKKEFALMKRGVRIVNCARGGIIEEDSLISALRSGKVAGCALDVFEQEPPVKEELISMPQVICSPHIGASTAEAQENVARQAAEQMLSALDGKPVPNAINAPRISPELAEALAPFILLSEKMGKLIIQLLPGFPHRVHLTAFGGLTNYDLTALEHNFIAGLLSPVLSEPVNAINAPIVARQRRLEVQVTKSPERSDFSELLRAEIRSGNKTVRVEGTVFAREPRIVSINRYYVDVVPSGYILICTNRDKPGVVKYVSSILAEAGINIATMTVGRDKPGGTALTAIRVDSPISSSVAKRISSSPLILSIHRLEL